MAVPVFHMQADGSAQMGGRWPHNPFFFFFTEQGSIVWSQHCSTSWSSAKETIWYMNPQAYCGRLRGAFLRSAGWTPGKKWSQQLHPNAKRGKSRTMESTGRERARGNAWRSIVSMVSGTVMPRRNVPYIYTPTRDLRYKTWTHCSILYQIYPKNTFKAGYKKEVWDQRSSLEK